MSEPRNDFDLQVPRWLQHVGPVAITAFCLFVAMSDYSVFEGFDEDEPGTYLSLLLMGAACAMSLAAMRNGALDRGTRIVAGVLGAVAGLAAYDEAFRLREAIGRWVDDLEAASGSKLAHFTDDIIILAGAVVGAGILYAGIKRTDRLRELWPYVVSVVLIALAHGVLDIVSHGTKMLKMLLPELSRGELRELEQQLGFYEEYCKIWTEWFVVLFLQRFVHRTRVSLWWPWQLFVAGGLAVVALSSLGGLDAVPYLILGKPLRLLRNPHVLMMLTLLWVAGTVVLWRVRQQSEDAANTWGLLFVLSPLLLMFARPDAQLVGGWVASLADALLPSAMWSARSWTHGLLGVLLLGPGLLLGGLGLLALRSPAAMALAERPALTGTGRRAGALAICALLTAAVLAATAAPFIPNNKYRDRAFEFWELKFQALDDDLGGGR